MKFIDAHMHFWDRAVLSPYVWLHEVPSIGERHTFDQLRAESPERLPDKVVFVEAGAPGTEEVHWVEKLAAAEPRIAAIVARLRVDQGGTTAAGIAELKRHPLVRGVRHHFEHDPADFCVRAEFIAGVRLLAAANLSFDLCGQPHQLPAIIELVRQCPATSFILDHAGKPTITTQGLDPWRSQMKTLAGLPNLVCKLSGLATGAPGPHWTTAQLAPFVNHLLQTFGPARLVFGSDWPVAKLATSYARWLDVVDGFLAPLTASEQAAIWHDNAARIYRL